jgi:DNA-binding CsgD family transcriptional regulator
MARLMKERQRMTHGEGSPGEALARAERLDEAMRVIADLLLRFGIPSCELHLEPVAAAGPNRIAQPVIGPAGWFATLVCSSEEAFSPALLREIALLATYLSVWCTERGLATPHQAHPLTPRQLEIAHRVARGETNAEIADALGISINTVKVRLKQVFERLDVCNRTELAAVLLTTPRS